MIAKKPPKREAPGAYNWPKNDWFVPVFLAVAVLLLRVWYVTSLTPYGLAPDEAQYWHWLTHNSLAFLTKPPLTTWAIGLSTSLLGDTQLGVKLLALLGQTAMPLLAMGLARDIVRAWPKSQSFQVQSAGWWAFCLVFLAPLTAVGGLIMAPDALLVPLWLGAAWAALRAVRPGLTEAQALCWPRWLIIGTLVGLAGLAKYSAGLFYPLLGLWLLIYKRHWLNPFGPGRVIYASGLLTLAFQAPVIYWNATHMWLGVEHVLWQVDGGGDDRHGGLGSLLDLLGSQWLVVGLSAWPVLLWVWGWGLAKWRKLAAPFTLLLAFTLPVFLIFLALSLTGKVQANWPVLATLPGLVLAGVWLGLRAPARTWAPKLGWGLLTLGLLVTAVLTTLLLSTPTARSLGVPLPLKTDPTKDLQGWPEMGQLLGLTLRELNNPIVLSTRYQTLAPLAFHTLGQPETIYLNPGNRRLTHYDLWRWPSLTNRLVVYVNEQPTLPLAVAERFLNCVPWHSLAVEDAHDNLTRRLATWVCWRIRPN